MNRHSLRASSSVVVLAAVSLDAEAAVDLVRARLPGEPVGVIGASMGGAAALLGPGPLRVDALVLESVSPTIELAVADRLRVRLDTAATPD